MIGQNCSNILLATGVRRLDLVELVHPSSVGHGAGQSNPAEFMYSLQRATESSVAEVLFASSDACHFSSLNLARETFGPRLEILSASGGFRINRALVSDKGAMTTTALAGLGDFRRAGTGGETVLTTAGPRSSQDIGDRAFQQWRRHSASVPGPH
ncbi:hypothetical protein ACFV2X_27825 [Streptomyces sp. NPDC059679]|uniref:hypothetical protein n=1 Tax=Streptomyces sp. NPDC059679 TaxID=3346903 RepID=UPI0036C3A629